MNRIYGILICLLVCNCWVKAQSFTEVVVNPYGEGAFPNDLTIFNDSLYFAATDSTHGYEPWVSGNPSGAQLVMDIFASTGNSFPQYLTADSNRFLFFQANDSIHGQELWATASNRTYLVKDIYPGPQPSLPQSLFVFNHKLYFQADDGVHGAQLWVSDGTTNGTQLLADINMANGDSAGSFPSGLTALNNQILFNATDSIHGYELWDYNGDSAFMVKDIYPDTTSSDPMDLTAYNGKLYFSANDGTHGTELWVTDGTPAGTQMVKDIFPGYQSSNPQSLTVFNNLLFFQANDGVHGPELWVSNGDSSGTNLLLDIYPGTTGSYPQNFAPYNSKLFFQANDSLHGAELWATDGTTSGTTLFADLNPGPNGSYPGFFTPYHNNLYFIAQPDSVSGAQLFVTNGTPNGTTDFILTGAALNPLGITNSLTVLGNYLAFSASYDTLTGQQLWYFNDVPVAVTQIEKAPAFTLYPNPCKDYYIVNGFNPGQSYTLKLTDITGRTMQVQQLQATGPVIQFSIPEISAGIYLLDVQSDQNTSTLRLVKGE